ncbi:hypothetical protein CHI12_11155 [Terribacillus saccharophilus]|jgi:hypothetical protein|uniref:Uncharacterized protein n=1 Tax=Terribacillus saccharophilus TaxID=361277 RepID=A0A268HC43_9BACI|nr:MULTISPECIES: hypothetical protein [Terribacillus]PAE07456.1 hypothetical protein CHI12_11155 [Terribacillus saccharophilus]
MKVEGKLKKMKGFVAASVIGIGLLAGSTTASAYADSNSASIPGLPNHSIQSNVWHGTASFFNTQSYQVSAKFLGTNPGYADWVKTAWTINANGLGVSIGGISGGTASGNTLSGTWTNWDAWISDYSGTYNISGVPISGSANNTASVFVDGTKAASTASIFRFY